MNTSSSGILLQTVALSTTNMPHPLSVIQSTTGAGESKLLATVSTSTDDCKRISY